MSQTDNAVEIKCGQFVKETRNIRGEKNTFDKQNNYLIFIDFLLSIIFLSQSPSFSLIFVSNKNTKNNMHLIPVQI